MEFEQNNQAIDSAKKRYLEFIKTCQTGPCDFSLTPRAEPTAFALCFALFGLHLLKQKEILEQLKPIAAERLRVNIRTARRQYVTCPQDKSFLQLLTFTLSALAIVDGLAEDPLAELVLEQISEDTATCLKRTGALKGRPQSGNHAMFYAILLIHARDYLNETVDDKIDQWIALHVRHMNRFGFWGPGVAMRHLFFQNGYHQYEIFEYLEQCVPRQAIAARRTLELADRQGHFAPYPGGGGCFDYDAVFMLTQENTVLNLKTETVLKQIVRTLLSEQLSDGGWAESLQVRPRGLGQMIGFVSHTTSAFPNLPLLYERFRYALALNRKKYDRIETHWSQYQREWGEADLWDSWFRMLAIARIQVAIESSMSAEWGFIDYPGIGYHPSLKG